MRILFWVPYPSEGASNRYRIEQYLPYLKKTWAHVLHPFWSSNAYKILYQKGCLLKKTLYFALGSLKRILDILFLFRYDIVIIHREAYPIGGPIFEALLHFFNKTFIFDFDDAIFLPTCSRANNFIEKFKRPDKVSSIISKSSYVIAGNSYLADFASRYSRDVCVIPTSIDTSKYKACVKDKKSDIVIGWVGSLTTIDFLAPLSSVFMRLSQKYPHIKFKIIGGNFSIHGLTNIVSKQWSACEEISDLQTFDIGIMPMLDNKWTNGKCGFKAILYMSCGIPSVCSAVGVNKEIISDGENGFLATTSDDWVNKLSFLIEDRELREKIALRARETVEEKFSVAVNAQKFIKVIQDVSKGKVKCAESAG